ncbi:MAG TPA: hypothetical protein VF097_07105 [Actinomycetota bacterium]
MESHENEVEASLREMLRQKAGTLPPPRGLSAPALRRTRLRIARTITTAALVLGLSGFAATAALDRLTGTSEVTPGGASFVQGATVRIRFDGSLGDLGCSHDGPRTVSAREEVTFGLTNDGRVDIVVDVLRFAEGKGFDDLVAYVEDPREDPEVAPEWATSQHAFRASPGQRESWTRALTPGEYGVVCYTTDPPRLWLLSPLTVAD